MNRLTVNKNVSEMNMVELAHNSCFAKNQKAMYRDYDTIIDARAFVRNLIKCRGLINNEDEIFHRDDAFDEFMAECLAIDPQNEIGLIALFYRGLWVQADLYEALKCYENLEEQGLLLKLPCKVGDTLWTYANYPTKYVYPFQIIGIQLTEKTMSTTTIGTIKWNDIGKTVFLTQAEAEEVLKKQKVVNKNGKFDDVGKECERWHIAKVAIETWTSSE